MARIEFSEFQSDDRPGTKVFVHPHEVAAVREWKWHSFRPAIGEIVLTSGEKVRVWETAEAINRRLVCEEDRMNKRLEEADIARAEAEERRRDDERKYYSEDE